MQPASGLARRASVLLLLSGFVVAAAGLPRATGLDFPHVPNPPLQTDLNNMPGDLRAVVAPEPSNLGDFVKNRQAAIALGKALLWDTCRSAATASRPARAATSAPAPIRGRRTR